jgi:hypothetical protein
MIYVLKYQCEDTVFASSSMDICNQFIQDTILEAKKAYDAWRVLREQMCADPQYMALEDYILQLSKEFKEKYKEEPKISKWAAEGFSERMSRANSNLHEFSANYTRDFDAVAFYSENYRSKYSRVKNLTVIMTNFLVTEDDFTIDECLTID